MLLSNKLSFVMFVVFSLHLLLIENANTTFGLLSF